MASPSGASQVPELLHATELHEAYPRLNYYPSITGRFITYVHIKHSLPGFILQTNYKIKKGCTGFSNPPVDFYWSDSPIYS